MGADIVSLAIRKIGTSVQYANTYEWSWRELNGTLFNLNLSHNLEPPIYDYKTEIAGRRIQQEIQGHRPYGKQAFVYAFPDFTGLSWCAAELVRHWFRLSLALWEAWLRHTLKYEGVVITTDFEAIADLVASGGFVQLHRVFALQLFLVS